MIMASSVGLAATSPLDSYRWQSRLVVMAAGASDPQVAAQRAQWSSDRAGWRDRDLRLVEVTGDEVRIDEEPTGLAGDGVRAGLGLPVDRFEAVLVGFDGGVKARRSTAFENATLYATIDSMPMRRQELRRRDGAEQR